MHVHWHEGLFLQPHHLQIMQRRLEAEVCRARALFNPFCFGVVESRLSHDDLWRPAKLLDLSGHTDVLVLELLFRRRAELCTIIFEDHDREDEARRHHPREDELEDLHRAI